MTKYKILNQDNPCVDRDFDNKLCLLYEGGKAILSNARLFLLKQPMENEAAYQDRLKNATYHNYLAEIVNDDISSLSSKPLSIVPAADATDEGSKGELPDAPEFYQEFVSDADLSGHPFNQIIMEAALKADILQRAYIGIDMPFVAEEATNRVEEELLQKDRAYLYHIPKESVKDWKKDRFGNFEWIILRSDEVERSSPSSSRDTKIIQFITWIKTDDVVSCKIEQFIIKANKSGFFREPKPDDESELVSDKVVSFSEIPIKEMCLPDGLWTGNLLFPLIIAHFRQKSALDFAETRAAFAVPFYQQSNDLEQIGNAQADKTNRGQNFRQEMQNKGALVGTEKDKFSFVEPEGHVFELMNEQLKELVDEIHRIKHKQAQSISATKTQKGRSGASKASDNRAEEMVLIAYATIIKEFAQSLYECIAEFRKDNVIWQTLGMDDFKMVDRAQLIDEATKQSLITIPSKTFHKANYLELALNLLPDCDPQTQIQIKQEIDDWVDSKEEDQLYPTDDEADMKAAIIADQFKPDTTVE